MNGGRREPSPTMLAIGILVFSVPGFAGLVIALLVSQHQAEARATTKALCVAFGTYLEAVSGTSSPSAAGERVRDSYREQYVDLNCARVTGTPLPPP